MNDPYPMPDLFASARWYAVYTFPRHERVVADQLTQKSVDNYLPLYEKLSHWKDRTCRLHLPLFPGYVFVRIALTERIAVLSTSGVVRLVGFNGYPVPLPDGEIESLRSYLSARRAEPYKYLTAGRRVSVSEGPLKGLEGVILRRKGRMRLVVSMDSIQRSVAWELEASDVRLAA